MSISLRCFLLLRSPLFVFASHWVGHSGMRLLFWGGLGAPHHRQSRPRATPVRPTCAKILIKQVVFLIFQKWPRAPQRRPAPRSPKGAQPRRMPQGCPKDAPRTPQGHPEDPQDPPRTLQGTPKATQRRHKDASRTPKAHSRYLLKTRVDFSAPLRQIIQARVDLTMAGSTTTA